MTAVSRDGLRIGYAHSVDPDQTTVLKSGFATRWQIDLCRGCLIHLENGACGILRFQRKNGSEIETLPLALTDCTG